MGQEFYVTRHDGAWRIRHNGRYSGAFDDPESAIRKVAVFARWSGVTSQITVHRDGRVSRIEWTADKDLHSS